MVRVPDRADQQLVELTADLHLTVSTDRGTAMAHLGGGPDGLILDVDRPAVFLRALPKGTRRLPEPIVRRLDPDVPIVVRSHNRDLGRLWVTRTGSARLVPTAAGLRTACVVALSGRRFRNVLLGAAAVLTVLASVTAVIRRLRILDVN